ncbi:MAG: TadE/TadG family type IV pilus assembly protein [Acidimicrobiales bacterium]
MAVELALLTPLLLLLLVFVVALGRLAEARQEVDDAASQAARAATVAGNIGDANETAQQAAAASLASDRVTCSRLTVTTNTSSFFPGGEVRVQVNCAVSLQDLSLLHLPGTETISAWATSPVDQYRSVSP